jgi:hypothetical protein
VAWEPQNLGRVKVELIVREDQNFEFEVVQGDLNGYIGCNRKYATG